MEFDRQVFAGTGFQCEGCGNSLFASESYCRRLYGLSVLFALALWWFGHVPGILFRAFGLPGFIAALVLALAGVFFVLVVVVRTVPYWVPPSLVLRHDGTVLTLHLGNDGGGEGRPT